jgi:GAF domain-containing protein
MRDLLRRLYPLAPYINPVERRQAIGTYAAATILLAVGILAALATVTGLPSGVAIDAGSILAAMGVFAVPLAAIGLTRNERQVLGAAVVLTVWFGVSGYLMIASTSDLVLRFGMILVGISLGALLIGEQTILFLTGLSVLFLLIGVAANPGGFGQPNPAGLLWTLGPLLVIHGGVNYALAQGIRSIARRTEIDLDQRRMRRDEMIGTIAQRLFAARLDLETLLKEMVVLIREAFDQVNDVQLFLVDQDKKEAMLAASTRADQVKPGEAAPAHRVGVGSPGVIGRVTISSETIVVRDSDEGSVYRRSAFLPDTRTELAVALRVGNEVIGVLDLQSQKADAFAPQDVEGIKLLANQVAVVVDNARLYTEAQTRSAENRRLYEQSQASLREIERLNQQLIGGAWAEYLRGMPAAPAYTLDLTTGRVEENADWTATLAESSRRNQAVIRQVGEARVLALPISVRGQVIGAMEFEIGPDQEIVPEQITVLQQIVERLGLAVENARLLEEAQRIAQREALVSEISMRLQAATGVEAVVAAATQSLADAFQSPHVAIRLSALVDEAN